MDLLDARILVVDDQEEEIVLLEAILGRAGYRYVHSTSDPTETASLCDSFEPDLILLDLNMPVMDGFEVLKALGRVVAPPVYVPVLVITADPNTAVRQRALALGVRDFAVKPFDPLEIQLRIKNLLESRFLHQELLGERDSLEAGVRERTAQLLQSEKLAEMGGLLAGVVHEINNPLTVALGQASLLRHALGADPLAARAARIEEAVGRSARIVRNFLALARQRPLDRQSSDLNEVVEGAIEMLAYPLRMDRVEVVLDLAQDLPHLWADPHQIHQVLVNLIVNAHQAMREQPDARRVTIRSRLTDDDRTLGIDVIDSGPGIPDDVKARIFEPFFTTKPPGQGTGLGLALSMEIIHGHGGRIEVETSVGSGTRFSLYLPVTDRTTGPLAGRSDETLGHPSRLHILVVDDELDVAEVLADMVGADGHAVDVLTDGAQALAAIEPGRYDVVFSDVRMPAVGGAEIAQAIDKRGDRPPRLVLVTGDGMNPSTASLLERFSGGKLRKPFTRAEVQRVLSQVMSAPAAGR